MNLHFNSSCKDVISHLLFLTNCIKKSYNGLTEEQFEVLSLQAQTFTVYYLFPQLHFKTTTIHLCGRKY